MTMNKDEFRRQVEFYQQGIFPQKGDGNPPTGAGAFEYLGLTKRELFAAMAMQGFIASKVYGGEVEMRASLAVKYADALLKELAK